MLTVNDTLISSIRKMPGIKLLKKIATSNKINLVKIMSKVPH